MCYLDHNGMPVFTSQGIGGPDGDWGAFRRKPSGSLARIKSIPMVPCRVEAEERLAMYAFKRKWLPVDEGRGAEVEL